MNILKTQQLINLHQAYQNCHKCSLCHTRKRVVVGTGDPNANILICGQSPGETEDTIGKPFVGQSGQVLDSIFSILHIKRTDLWITNALWCFIKPKEKPPPDSISICRHRLWQEIGIINPQIIICLGTVALEAVSRYTGSVWASRKITLTPQYINPKQYHYIGTYHPVRVLYGDAQQGILDNIVEDFKKAINFVQIQQYIWREII